MLQQCTTALSMLEEREEKLIMKEEAEAFRKDRDNFIQGKRKNEEPWNTQLCPGSTPSKEYTTWRGEIFPSTETKMH
jgi:hypothetical protein